MEIQSFKRMTAINADEVDDSPMEEPVDEEEISKSPPRGEKMFSVTKASETIFMSLLLVLSFYVSKI
jgi:hypothetical protein